jgi:hypothetical protein
LPLLTSIASKDDDQTMKVKTKPYTPMIEAIQWTGDLDSAKACLRISTFPVMKLVCTIDDHGDVLLFGYHGASQIGMSVGDWIINDGQDVMIRSDEDFKADYEAQN